MFEPSSWQGIFPAALTMFDANGAIDAAAQTAHLTSLLEQGVHGFVLAGTSGEFIGLDRRERAELVEISAAAVDRAVPIIAGTGAYGTAETIAMTRDAAAAGADGAIVILPYYQRPARHEVVEHFRAIARSTDLPIMLYNNPANSGTNPLSDDDIAMLAREGVLHAVKSTFPTVHQVHEVRAACDADFRVFYGSFMAPLEGMAGGADGWVSGVLNVAAVDAVNLWNAMQRGDLTSARAAWARILPLKYLYTKQRVGDVSDLEIYRSILRMRGQVGGHSRAPLLPLDENQERRLADQLRRDGVPL